MSIRVYELAKSLGVESKVVMSRLAELNIFVRAVSSPVRDEDAKRLRESFGDLGLRVPREAKVTSAEGWRAGAIRPPQDPAIQAAIARMCAAFSAMGEHQQVLQKLGSQIVYAGYCREPKFTECAIALVRFSGAIEAAFGLTREVLFFYSPHRDAQIRTYHAAKIALKQVPREVTPDMIFFWSSDPRLKPKLDDWSSGGFMAIPLVLNSSEDPISFIELLRDYIFSRDLFYETTPVHGDRFFGRRPLLQGIRDDIRNRRVAGIYGLRKAGKTSVLTELQAGLDSPSNLVILQDLENMPSPPDDPVPDLLREMRNRVSVKLREHGYKTQFLADSSTESGITEFKAAMSSVLSWLAKHHVQLTLMLDEIEYLTPGDVIDVREGPMPSIAQFLGMLRSLVQENDNFTFLLSGLTTAITESGRLYGRPNPLFSWAKAYFLAPLERNEADEMALSIGGRMGVRIHSGALEALYEASGGHAFLFRHLASHSVSMLPLNVFERELTRQNVLASIESWRRLVSGNVREMVDHVRRYYPEEAFLLEVLRADPTFFEEVATDEPLAVGHLLSLGLIRQAGREYEVSTVLDLL